MARLTAAERARLPKSDFAIPEKGAYPIENRSHAANAESRVSQYGTPSEKARVDAAVHRRYPDMGKRKKPEHSLAAVANGPRR